MNIRQISEDDLIELKELHKILYSDDDKKYVDLNTFPHGMWEYLF